MAIDTGNGPSGSIGPVIHYTRKGKKCIRVKPAHVYNPNTPKQKSHRDKMVLSSRFIKSIDRFIRIGYQEATVDTPLNEARQHIIRDCFKPAEKGVELEYSKIIIARGEIPEPQDYKMDIIENSATITWKTNRKLWSNDVKVMVAMFIDEEKDGISQMLGNVAYQSKGMCTVPVPIHTKPVHVWMFFSNSELFPGENREKISNSVYLGAIE